ncbi:sel1 repeat family protein [Streptomyces armeniacus]|uniref:Sel1 repeat family protein n=1 Tax=Streptomyces armeniacus TaxID=83291 RepID=A0A345XKW8_9ACTN|nr:sel1 repeat family protein [Streptomyces armeniacus]AXK32284.1 sel1 repeat family protein [Streptomyces armeniacus]
MSVPATPDAALWRLVRAAYDDGHPISMQDAARAAELGYVQGMVVYGIGLGNVGRDAEAEGWLRRSITHGDPMGSVALGTLYLDRGDLDEAERVIRPVAESGNAGAKEALAEIRQRRAARR